MRGKVEERTEERQDHNEIDVGEEVRVDVESRETKRRVWEEGKGEGETSS